MITNFEITKDQEKTIIMQYCRLRMKPVFIFLVVLLCVAVFALVFGYCVAKKDANLLASGYSMLVFSILGIIVILITGNKIVKMYLNNFEMISENGRALMKLELVGDNITLTNETKGNVSNFTKKDIVSVREYKDIIVAKLVTKQQLHCQKWSLSKRYQ